MDLTDDDLLTFVLRLKAAVALKSPRELSFLKSKVQEKTIVSSIQNQPSFYNPGL